MKTIKTPKTDEKSNKTGVPFDSVEEVWFWFITAQQARNEGAKFVAGLGAVQRPCEPIDILKILDNLYRSRLLKKEHFLVLRHYGRRHMAPDPRRIKEKRSHHIWREAMDRLEPVFIRKGIVEEQHWFQMEVAAE